MKRNIYLIIILFSTPTLLNAQDKEEWTLQECIDYGLDHNLDVRQGILGMEFAKIDYDQARYSRFPSLNAGGRFQNNWGRYIDPTTNDFNSTSSNSLGLNASSAVTIYNGFRIQNSIRQANYTREASIMDLEASKDQVILNIISTFMNVIFNKELYENAVAQLNSTKQQVSRTNKQVEAGSVPRSNLLELQAQEATNELAVINQENALNLSMLQLKQYLQIPASRNIELEIPDINLQLLQAESIEMESVYNEAINNLPIVKSAELYLEGSEYGIESAKGNLQPTLSLSGGMTSNYSSFINDNTPGGYSLSSQINDNIAEYLNVNLSIPIFNGFAAKFNVERARLNKISQEINLEQTKNIVRQNIEIAYNDVIAANKSYVAAEKQVNAREESFRMTEQRYNLGAADFTEYQIAENDLFQAKSDLLRAKYDLIYKLKILDFYQGKPLEF